MAKPRRRGSKRGRIQLGRAAQSYLRDIKRYGTMTLFTVIVVAASVYLTLLLLG